MSAVTPSQAQAAAATPAASPLRAVPVAVWALVGGLALATAGLTGALVMRAADPAPAGSPIGAQAVLPDQVAAADPIAAAATPTTTTAQQQARTQVHAAQAHAQPAPVHRTPRPAPSQPVAVAQAAPQPAPAPVVVQPARAAVCAVCGTVESVHAVQQKGQGSGLGVVAGGVLGGVVGHQFGGGNGRTAMTLLGAAGGALAGNEVEKRARASTSYDVRVRMDDGSVRTFRQGGSIAAGTRVTVEGNLLRVGARQG